MIQDEIFANSAVKLPLTQDSTTFREDVANAHEGVIVNRYISTIIINSTQE